jgi:hypothetical protein
MTILRDHAAGDAKISTGGTASALFVQDIQVRPAIVNRRPVPLSSRIGHNILVLANDPLLAALVGGLAELAHFHAAFARPGETPEDALMRVRPAAAILVDGQARDADDLLVARARKRGIAVLMFGPASVVDARRKWGDEQGVGVFALPEEIPALINELERLREPEPKPAKPRVASRRAHTERNQEGTLIFDDGNTRWSVYDRRTHDDRRSNNKVDRQFVDEHGAVLHCDVSEDEAASISVAVLSRQLARAVPIER